MIVRLWDVATGEEIRAFKGHEDAVWSVAFSPDGARVLTGSWDKTARLWDSSTGKEILTFEGHEGRLFSVAFKAASSISPAPGYPTMTFRASARTMASISRSKRGSARKMQLAGSPRRCPTRQWRNENQNNREFSYRLSKRMTHRGRFGAFVFLHARAIPRSHDPTWGIQARNAAITRLSPRGFFRAGARPSRLSGICWPSGILEEPH